MYSQCQDYHYIVRGSFCRYGILQITAAYSIMELLVYMYPELKIAGQKVPQLFRLYGTQVVAMKQNHCYQEQSGLFLLTSPGLVNALRNCPMFTASSF
jgi:hypothetical protein